MSRALGTLALSPDNVMNETGHPQAWIERSDASIVPLQSSCSLGRAANNQIVLRDEKVSRNHAVIHRQDDNEYWLVDLGSSNGTYLNGRRVAQPMQLTAGASIQIGSHLMRFCLAGAEPSPAGEIAEHTVMDIRSSICWLLLADIEGSSTRDQTVPPEQLSITTGRWFSNCKQLIESNGGTLNKYLGDGFLAYWPGGEADSAPLLQALQELKQLQLANEPPFRLVLHLGLVCLGGAPSLGEESLSGAEVNFVFRMEKLAASLRQRCMVSSAGAARLRDQLAVEPLGKHSLPSFNGQFEFWSF
ncbi:MAG TPA: adenylate/guanylate cyclase domain-containing protein [Verrucomicrobiota bacterium]|nr:adenylate/guanylate cyclase domain-containing protein [Verrucomicrobiota bacterium]